MEVNQKGETFVIMSKRKIIRKLIEIFLYAIIFGMLLGAIMSSCMEYDSYNNPLTPQITALDNGQWVIDRPAKRDGLEVVNEIAKTFAQAVDYKNPTVRNLAVSIVPEGQYNISQVCAIFDYLNSNWKYVGDPNGFNYVAKGSESIYNNFSGDCDDYAALMAAMIAAIGGTPRIILAWNEISGHAYPEVFLGDGANMVACVSSIRSYYQKGFLQLFGQSIGTINCHVDANGKYWLNLDYSARYPGGEYYKAARRIIAISPFTGTYRIIL